MDSFSLLACLPSLGPIATHISDKSKHLRKRKIIHTKDSRLLSSRLGIAASNMSLPTKSSLDDRQSQTLGSSIDIEKEAETLRSETDAAKPCVSELE